MAGIADGVIAGIGDGIVIAGIAAIGKRRISVLTTEQARLAGLFSVHAAEVWC
jgi:hypothetical protein